MMNFENDHSIAKGGVAIPFPFRLHECLEFAQTESMEHIISWRPHGRAFVVLNPDLFVRDIMPRFFAQTKFASFQRQLNLYGFNRLNRGTDKGCYYHLSFIRGNPSYVKDMPRIKIKGASDKRRTMNSQVHNEPNFYLPEWKDHLEPSIPPSLRSINQDRQDMVVTPVSSPVNSPKRMLEVMPLDTVASMRQSAAFVSLESVAPLSPAVGETNCGEPSQHEMEMTLKTMGIEPQDLEPTPLPVDIASERGQPVFKLLDKELNIFKLSSSWESSVAI